MIKKILCLLWFNHDLTTTSIESRGNKREFRYINSCSCGQRVEKENWTNDNRVLGHGRR